GGQDGVAAARDTIGDVHGALAEFFFFQAEDGIRDRTVTGVQTCALPILPVIGVSVAEAKTLTLRVESAADDDQQLFGVWADPLRSEERRVGKECRWRWAEAQEYRER